MKTLIIAGIICLMGISTSGLTQDYQTGIGIRGGLYNGLTIKSFLNTNTAIEGLVTTRWRGYTGTLLLEKHTNTEGIRFYYGAGGHIGVWEDNRNPFFDRNGRYSVVGFDGILGTEVNFKVIPFNISLDWKPSFNLTPAYTTWYDEFALSLRLIF